VNFLFRPEETFAGAYTGLFAVCFMLSLSLVLAENTLSLHLARLDTDARKEHYGRWWAQTLRDAWKVYQRIYQAFLAGVAMLGPVKLWEYNQTSMVECDLGSKAMPAPCQQVYTDNIILQQHYSRLYGSLIVVAGLSFLFICRYFIDLYTCMSIDIMLSMKAEKKEMDKITIVDLPANAEEADAEENGSKTSNLTRSLSAAERVPFKDIMEDISIPMTACTFQTGNVFYEVVFTVVNPDAVAVNVIYLGMSLVTLCFGTLTIVCCQTILFWILDFQDDEGKERFAKNSSLQWTACSSPIV